MSRFPDRLAVGRRPYIVFAILAFALTAPFFILGIHSGADLPQHVQFADTYSSSINRGDPLPGWGADENKGYGSLGVRFYPPLTGFLTGVAKVATGSWLWSFAAVIFLFTFIGGIGVFHLAAEFTGSRESLAAGLFFIVSPYHVSEIFSTFFYAQYAGAACLAFALLFTARVCRTGLWSDAALLAAAYGLLILTHLPLAIIGSLSMPVFALFLLDRGRLWISIAKLASGAALGLAASSFYWIKIVFELDLVRHSETWQNEIFRFYNSFLLVPPNDIVYGLWFNNLILLTLAAFAGCALYSVWKTGTAPAFRRMKAPVALFLFAVFMTTPLSYPLWAFVPYLKDVQFPWRWLSVVNIAASVITGSGIAAFAGVVRSRMTWKNPAIWGAAAVILLSGAFIYKVVSRYANEHIPAAGFDSWAEARTEDLGFRYFWTAGTDPDVFSGTKKVIVRGREVAIESWDPEKRVFAVTAGGPSEARVATLFYPHWKAVIDDRSVRVSRSDNGAILVPVPDAESEVTLFFEEPAYVRTAELVSASTWLLIFVFVTVAMIRRRRRAPASPLSTAKQI